MPGAESQRRGETLEEGLAGLLGRLLLGIGCEVVEGPRIEPPGSQHGRDIVIRFRYPFSAHIWTVLFECKNQKNRRLAIADFAGKPHQVSVSGLDIDSWVVVAPHVRLATEAYDYLPQLQSQFTFNLSVLTPDQNVENFFALEPDLYEVIYERKPVVRGDSAKWQKWLLEALDKLGYLQRVVSHSIATMEVIHPGEVENKRVSSKSARQQLAEEFYRGQIPEWKHIANDLDFRRFDISGRLAEFRQLTHEQGGVHLILALSEAGTGKSVFLMREALEATKDGTIVLYSGSLPRENLANALVTAIRAVQDRAGSHRMLLVLDNAASIAEELGKVLLNFYIAGRSLTVLVADRLNRWRDAVGDQTLEQGTTVRFPGKIHFLTLSQLTESEQRALISKLREFPVSRKVTENSDDELISKLEHYYRGQLMVFLLELLEGRRFEAIIREERADFEARHQSKGFLYRATAAFHQFGVDMPESVVLRFLNVAQGQDTQDYHDILQAALESRLLRIDSLNRLTTRHEIIAQVLFDGLSQKAQKDILIDLITSVDPDEESEVSALATILVDPSRRSDVWAKPYRWALYEIALRKFPDNPHLRDVAALLCIHEDRLEVAYDIVGAQRSVTTIQNLARAEFKKGHQNVARALYCEALGLAPDTTDDELLASAAPGAEIEHSLTKEATDNIVVTDFARFLSTHQNQIALALLQCLGRAGKADAYSTHLLTRCLRKAGRTDEAINLLREGRERFPDSAPVFSLDLIQILRHESRSEGEIEAAYQEAVRCDWADSLVYTSYARFVKKTRGREACREVFKLGVQAAPDPGLYLEFAETLQSDQRERALREGMKMFPLDGAMYNELGRLLVRRKQTIEANNVFRRGLQACPNQGHLYTEYALFLNNQGYPDKAEDIFRAGIKATPLNGPLYNAFAIFLDKKGRHAEAEEVLRNGIEQSLIHPEACYHELARLLDRHGYRSEAETFYKLGMKRFPLHHHFYVDYGLQLRKQKRFRTALHVYQRGMEVTGGQFAPLAQVLGRLLIRIGRDEEAIHAFETGLEATKQVEDPDKREKQQAAIFTEWMRLFWYRGRDEQAEEVGYQAIQACPNELVLYIFLAIALQSQGKSNLAEVHLSKALSLASSEEDRQRVLETFHSTFRQRRPRSFKTLLTDVKGRIKFVNLECKKPFGFVTSEDGEDFYFRLSRGAETELLTNGELCEFDTIEYPNGMRGASYVQAVDWDSY